MKSEDYKLPVAAAAMVCHPPIILPRIGKGEEKKIQDITDAFEKIAAEIREASPDTLVIISPHAPSYLDYIQISAQKKLRGDMSQFGDYADSFETQTDMPLVKEMARLAAKEDFPMGTMGRQDGRLDHGTMVPLYFLKKQLPDIPVVRLSIGGLSNLDHYHAGQILQQAAENLGRTIAVIGSGDLSHCQKEGSSYGYKPCGPLYDQQIMEIMSEGNFLSLVNMPEKQAEEAMACGHRSFCLMAGALDGKQIESHPLAHSAVFGVGYGMCLYTHPGPDASRYFYARAKEERQVRFLQHLEKEDAWIRLARSAIEQYVKTRTAGTLPDDLPEAFYTEQAGVFVSLHKDGQLRGCIGTTAPVQKNLGEEIQMNAVSACSRDPRFYPVREDELDQLEISVDVLKTPQRCTENDLDPARYGVIVSKNGKQALLLPDLEGIDTVEKQLQAVKQKAGLKADEKGCSLSRFEVVRHEV